MLGVLETHANPKRAPAQDRGRDDPYVAMPSFPNMWIALGHDRDRLWQ
jgi:hypothetical protein